MASALAFISFGVFAQLLLLLSTRSLLCLASSLEAARLGGDSFVCLIGEGSSGCSPATSSWLVGQDTPLYPLTRRKRLPRRYVRRILPSCWSSPIMAGGSCWDGGGSYDTSIFVTLWKPLPRAHIDTAITPCAHNSTQRDLVDFVSCNVTPCEIK